MIIEEGFGNNYYGNLIIQNYPNLQSIVVKKNSLKICNCEKLKTIEIEDIDRVDVLKALCAELEGNRTSAFSNVKNVIIESK